MMGQKFSTVHDNDASLQNRIAQQGEGEVTVTPCGVRMAVLNRKGALVFDPASERDQKDMEKFISMQHKLGNQILPYAVELFDVVIRKTDRVQSFTAIVRKN